jgi:4-carboxymuconolactone decarboxylase
MTNTRLPLVDDSDDPEVAAMVARPMVGTASALNVSRLLAGHPELYKRISRLFGLYVNDTLLTGWERELVILRAAWRAGSEYEFAQHRVIGARDGITDEVAARLCEESPDLPEPAATLVALVDELHRDVALSDGTWERLRARYDDRRLLELLLLPGIYRALAGVLNTVGVPLDDGFAGWFPG